MATRLSTFCILATACGLSVLTVAAQELVTVRVFTEPSGPRFTVDGEQYIAPVVFRWPVGSKHAITIPSATFGPPTASITCGDAAESGIKQYADDCRSRYNFSGWTTSGGAFTNSTSAFQTITVDKTLSFVKATFSAEHKVNVVFFDRSGALSQEGCQAQANYPGTKPPGYGPGVVSVAGACLDRTASVWASAGAIGLQAIPFEGYVFRGWTFDNSPMTQAQISSIEVKGPMLISPRFEPAKRVRIYTNPPELKVRIDSSVVATVDRDRNVATYPIPGFFDWVGGSQHTIAGVSPQIDIENRTWVFKNWSNGGGDNMLLRIDDQTNVSLEVTANYVRGVHTTFITQPAGLKLIVEGRDHLPSTNFVWGVGTTYDVSAPAEQVDAKGRKYLFKGWSNGGPAAQKVTPTEAQIQSGIRMTAIFEAVPQAVLQTSIPGIKIGVDGVQCASPCRLDKPAGTVLNLSVPTTIEISEATRYEFIHWSDGAPANRTLTVGEDTDTVVAMYRTAHRLMLVADPGEGADLSVQPASSDGFYPAGSNVTIFAEAKSGFRFRRWDGDLSGTDIGGIVTMSLPRVVRAKLDRVPYVAPAGVRNAAADLPEPGVAPGLIAIYGGGLANAFEVGSAAPLSQTLGGTVVLVEDRLLPLVYVSPEQINAQLPADLEPGEHNLVVRTEGMADVTAKFDVVRNAPGLFSNLVDGTAYAIALHEDGSPVTAASPAKRTETISLLGTGFGPYNRRVLDGFATPATPAAALVDPIEVIAGGVAVRPSFTGAAPGLVGLTVTRFRVTAANSGLTEVKVSVNGKESNTVILPLE